MWTLLLLIGFTSAEWHQGRPNFFNFRSSFVPAPAKYFGQFPVDDEPIYSNSRFAVPQIHPQPPVYPFYPRYDQAYPQPQQQQYQPAQPTYPSGPVGTYQTNIPAVAIQQPPVVNYPQPSSAPYQQPSNNPYQQPSAPPSYNSARPVGYGIQSANAAGPLCSPNYNYGSGPAGGYGGSVSGSYGSQGGIQGPQPVVYSGSAYFPILPQVDLSRCFTRYSETRIKGVEGFVDATVVSNVEECLVACAASWSNYQVMCYSVTYEPSSHVCELFNATARHRPGIAYMQYGYDYYEPTNCPGCQISDSNSVFTTAATTQSTAPPPLVPGTLPSVVFTAATTPLPAPTEALTDAPTLAPQPDGSVSGAPDPNNVPTANLDGADGGAVTTPIGALPSGSVSGASAAPNIAGGPTAATTKKAGPVVSSTKVPGSLLVIGGTTRAQPPLSADCTGGKAALMQHVDGQKLKAEGVDLSDVSLDECTDSCKTNDGGQSPCLSAVYNSAKRICTLFSGTAAVPLGSGQLIADPQFIYVEKTCVSAGAVAKCGRTPSNTIDRQSGKLIVSADKADGKTTSAASMADCIEKCLISSSKCLSASYFYQIAESNCVLSAQSAKTSPQSLKNAVDLKKKSEYFGFDKCGTPALLKDKSLQKVATTPQLNSTEPGKVASFLSKLIGNSDNSQPNANRIPFNFPSFGQSVFGGGSLANLKPPFDFRLRDAA